MEPTNLPLFREMIPQASNCSCVMRFNVRRSSSVSQFARAVLYILAQSALMRFSSIFALGHGSQSKLRPSLANANSLRVSSSARWVVAPTRTYTPSSLPSDFTKYGHFEPPMTSTAITDFPSMFSIPTSIGTRGEQPFMMELTMPSISANT